MAAGQVAALRERDDAGVAQGTDACVQVLAVGQHGRRAIAAREPLDMGGRRDDDPSGMGIRDPEHRRLLASGADETDDAQACIQRVDQCAAAVFNFDLMHMFHLAHGAFCAISAPDL